MDSIDCANLTLLDEHIAENIRIEDLAALVHTSPSHFARAFKSATGHTPHFYLTI